MTKTQHSNTRITTTPPPPRTTSAIGVDTMGRRQYTTGLTAPVLALALAGCDKAVEPVADSTDTSDTDAPKGWLRRFIDKVTDFDEPSDYGIAGGVAIGTVAVVSAAAGGGGSDSASSGGGASNPTPTNPTPTPTNTAPSFSTDTATATAIAENSGASQVVYTPTAPTDPEGDTIAYSLSGTDAGLFTIDSGTGAVTLTGDPNFETKASYAFTIIATDTGGLADELAVTLAITNVVEAPSFASSTATGATIAENSPLATAVYTAPVATADMNGSVTYSVVDGSVAGDGALFTIDQNTRKVTFKANPNYETKSSYKFKVRATDGSDATKYTETDEITVTLTNLDDNTPVLATGTTTSVNENVAANDSATAKGSAFVIYNASTGLTDADGSGFSHTYSLAAADLTTYGIDSSTGEVWFRASPDYEQRASIDLDFTVTVTDTNTDTTKNSASKTVTVTVTDVNESAVFTVRGSVNASNKGVLTAEKLTDDPEGNGTFTYQWQRSSDGATGWADIGSATGTSYTPVDGTSNDGGKYLRVKITYTDTANNAHTIYDNITENGGHIQHRIFSGTDTSGVTANADIFTTDISGSGSINDLEGGGGDDTLIHVYKSGTGSVTSGRINGGSGNDTLIGGTSEDTLHDRDNLNGGAGNDILDGRGGVDTLRGGAGNDIFVLDTTADAVSDFATGDKVRIDTTEASVTSLATLKSTASIDWTNTTNDARASGSGGVSGSNDGNTNDTIIYNVGADGALGGGDDTLLMVLEDYTTALTFADFDII